MAYKILFVIGTLCCTAYAQYNMQQFQSQNQAIYEEAKAYQIQKTTWDMDSHLNLLNERVITASKGAADAMSSATQTMIGLINQYAGSKAPGAIDELYGFIKPYLSELQSMGPNDVASTLSESPHIIEHAKQVLVQAQVPESQAQSYCTSLRTLFKNKMEEIQALSAYRRK